MARSHSRGRALSISQGGLPIGAVLTRDNKIIARGHNNRVQEKNVILHGEMSCLRDAGVISFHDTVMYTTLSPCSMCAGAIGLFKLSLLVIGESVTFPGQQGHPDPVRHSLYRSRRRALDRHDEELAIRSRQ